MIKTRMDRADFEEIIQKVLRPNAPLRDAARSALAGGTVADAAEMAIQIAIARGPHHARTFVKELAELEQEVAEFLDG